MMMMMVTIDDDHPKGEVVTWNMDVNIDCLIDAWKRIYTSCLCWPAGFNVRLKGETQLWSGCS